MVSRVLKHIYTYITHRELLEKRVRQSMTGFHFELKKRTCLFFVNVPLDSYVIWIDCSQNNTHTTNVRNQSWWKSTQDFFNEYYLSMKLITSNNKRIACSWESKLLDIIMFCMLILIVTTKDKRLATYVAFDTLETLLTRSYFPCGCINLVALLHRIREKIN